MHEHPTPHQKTHQKSAPTSSGYGDLSNTPISTAPITHWVHEPEAAKHLAIRQNTLRAMRRDGRLSPSDHYIFATGNLGGPVVYDIDTIRKTLAERTNAAVQEKESRRKDELERRLGLIETYGEEDHLKKEGE
tara:strand:- start:3260 stop:3658 length:399 start_codon:yes stop_codon:yes gene_type:complete